MVNAVRRLQFCAGHRVYQHESKCANLHGHNYVVYLYAQGELDSIGRVIDFSVLKNCIGSWIEKNWDHTFIVYEKDVELRKQLLFFDQPKPIFYLPTNPTAENMALYLLYVVCPKLLFGSDIVITKIVLYETENCFVEVSL